MEVALECSRAMAEAAHAWLSEVRALDAPLRKITLREWADKSSLDLGFVHTSGMAVLLFAGRLVTKGVVELSEASPCCLEGLTYNNNWYGCFACSREVLAPAPHETHLGHRLALEGPTSEERHALAQAMEIRLQTFGLEPLRAQLEAATLEELIHSARALLFSPSPARR